MTRDDLQKNLRYDAMPMMLHRFGDICLDRQAKLTAVHDFESFQDYWRSVRNSSARRDRMKKLYNLYVAISNTPSAFSIDQFRYLKTRVEGYEKVSMSLFLDDIADLLAAGILIAVTPTLDALANIK